MHYKCSNQREFCENSFIDFQQNCLERPCCCCFKRPKIKGKFEVAYMLETSGTKCSSPLGWQVEFEDTPSKIDHNLKKMMKWIKCPPLGDCCNLETNFLSYPEICGNFLKNSKQTCKEEEPHESFYFIKRPTVERSCPKPSCSDCQKCRNKQSVKKCCSKETQMEELPKCSYSDRKKETEKQCCSCQKNSSLCCYQYCRSLPKCPCNNFPSDQPHALYSSSSEQKKSKCVGCTTSKYCKCEGKDSEKRCSYCQNSNCCSSNEEGDVCSCDKIIHENCCVEKNCIREVNDDVLKEQNGTYTQERKIEGTKNENEKKKDDKRLPKTKRGDAHEQVEKEVKNTNYDADHPSLLERIKKAHHKQLHEIHSKID